MVFVPSVARTQTQKEDQQRSVERHYTFMGLHGIPEGANAKTGSSQGRRFGSQYVNGVHYAIDTLDKVGAEAGLSHHPGVH